MLKERPAEADGTVARREVRLDERADGASGNASGCEGECIVECVQLWRKSQGAEVEYVVIYVQTLF